MADETFNMPQLGEEGDVCGDCGTALAVDQRYCLNCGARRGGLRIPFERYLGGPQPAVAAGPSARQAVGGWSPVTAIGAIAVLGIMLLLGVLIGKDDKPEQVSNEPVVVQGTPTTSATDTAAAATPAETPKKAPKGADVAGAGNTVAGGSGTTEGIATADTNASALENAKGGPDQVATEGEPEEIDPGPGRWRQRRHLHRGAVLTMAAGRKRPGFTETLRIVLAPRKRAANADARAKGVTKTAASNGTGPATAVGPARLAKRRDELAREFAALQFDLGGMAYEMAARDHFRLDVLQRHAAKLQAVDAELGQIERMLKLDEAGAAGSCPSCQALQARGAVFCWQCGKELQEPTVPEGKPVPK